VSAKLRIGLPKESRAGETRVAITPEGARKLLKKQFSIVAEKDVGLLSGFPDSEYPSEVEWSDAKTAFAADVVLKINRPTDNEVALFKPNAVLITQIEPFRKDGLLDLLAKANVTTLGMELIPRIPRAQAMDVLSSQANISGYRSVIEAAAQYGKFFPLMMTAAGSSKPAKIMVLGAGVAGLQAVATARRLGAIVEAYDVRSEVKEQIQSLGAKFVELDIGEDGSGQGGYAKELSDAAKARLAEQLNDRLKKCDIIITTANIPGRKAPIMIPEEVVKAMRPGSVIVDLAAPTGGNCALTEPDKVVSVNGVKIIGYTNLPAMLPSEASNFYSNNLIALIDLLIADQQPVRLNLEQQDDIIKAILVTRNGDVLHP
jgi:NAD(P) transhydrogenase subunit alpha